MERYYVLDKKYNNPEIEQKIERLVDIKKDVLKELENCRRDKMIKSSLEADITLFVSDEPARALMAAMGVELSRFFQVASVTLAPEKAAGMTDYETPRCR